MNPSSKEHTIDMPVHNNTTSSSLKLCFNNSSIVNMLVAVILHERRQRI